MLRYYSKLHASAFHWFGIIMAVFALATEISGQQVYLSSSFYLTLSIAGFLASISISSMRS